MGEKVGVVTYPLYGGAVELMFDSVRHVYTVGGKRVLSVTGVAAPKPALVWWAAKEAARHIRENLRPGVSLDEIEIEALAEGATRAHSLTSKRAASIGTLAHEACERFAITGVIGEPPLNPQALASFMSFLDWWKVHKVKVHDSEKKVYSVNHKYAGTADLFCEVDGVPCIVDLKTSNAIYDDYLMQLGAYANARNEELEDDVYRQGWIVRLPKDGGLVETRPCDADGLDKAFHAFRGLLDYYKWAAL